MFTSFFQSRPSDITRRIEEEVQALCRDRQIAALMARRDGTAEPAIDCGCVETRSHR
ncbi:hypothetical protein [Mesobacterium pallidum]|uniref:hypothetical protein n=1 Tax=Mesobacterium pallidum TaxID=2872037 RepID=UPI001EE3234D|nr:hypothetical protein [Mesobacterium pallidum]